MRGFTTHEVMAYSAYYDVRNSHKPIIRVIGVTRRKDPEKVICRMYYKYGTGTSGGKYNNNISLFINYNDTNIEPFRDVRGKILVLEEALYQPNSTKSSFYLNMNNLKTAGSTRDYGKYSTVLMSFY